MVESDILKGVEEGSVVVDRYVVIPDTLLDQLVTETDQVDSEEPTVVLWETRPDEPTPSRDIKPIEEWLANQS